jgi:hypothetical protein
VVASIGHEERQRGKSIQDPYAIPWPRKALQQLLENQAGYQQRLACLYGAHQFARFGPWGRRVASERERPDAGIDKQAQCRVRSAL